MKRGITLPHARTSSEYLFWGDAKGLYIQLLTSGMAQHAAAFELVAMVTVFVWLGS